MTNKSDTSNGLKEKKLLIISHNYNDFVKDSSESVSAYFKEVNICVRYNLFAQMLSYLPLDNFKQYTKERHIDLLNAPSNINVIPTSILYGYSDSQYKNIGDKHFKSVEKTIKNKNFKFDLIYSHFTWSAGYVGAKLKEKYNVPLIVIAHGYDIYDLPFRDEIWREKIKYVLNTADYVITVSYRNLYCIKKLNITTPVKVIPNGFNSTLFFPRDSKECRRILNLPFDKKIILTVGSLVKIKGQQYLIGAISEVIKYRKDICCIIVGSGELKNKLKQQIKVAGLENHVKLAGGRPHNEIPIWMNACDTFVLPSLNEGNPTVMFECLGCRKPFVGTRVGGVPEIITSEDYGLLAEPADSKNLAEKILIALDKKWNYENISKYTEQYTWENIAKEILIIYQRVIWGDLDGI